MSKKDEIKRLWAETFGDSRDFVEMYFDRVYRDSDAMTLTGDDRHIVSSLLLQQYSMTFHGLEAKASYISGALTQRNMRGRGLMSSLMTDALIASHDRGDILTLLIPASDYLYGYYARFGFATAIFTDIMRYTSLHSFASPEEMSDEVFTPVEDLFDPRVYDAMSDLEHEMKQSVILHSHRDFLNILDDLRLDSGYCAAVASPDGSVEAIAWARPATDGSDIIVVNEILYRTPAARYAALRLLRSHWPDRPFAVMAPVADDGRQPTKRGMARITGAETALDLLAQAYPDLRLNIRVSDPIISTNNGIFSLAAGRCRRKAGVRETHLDFDVDITTLTELLFSSPKIGNVTGLPARRLHMALMLD